MAAGLVSHWLRDMEDRARQDNRGVRGGLGGMVELTHGSQRLKADRREGRYSESEADTAALSLHDLQVSSPPPSQ